MKALWAKQDAAASRFLGLASEFLFASASPAPLAALRIGLSALLLMQAQMLSGALFELLGQGAILQGALRPYLPHEGIPTVQDLALYLSRFGVSEGDTIVATALVYVSSLFFLMLGLRTRLAATFAWLTHTLLLRGDLSTYGVDAFAHIFLFYLIWVPSSHAFSLDRLAGRVKGGPSSLARLSLRVLQLQLCLVYFDSGVEKAMAEQWWNGEVIWRALMLPLYYQYDVSWLAFYPWLAKLLSWGTLAIEIGYPFFIWSRKTRYLWLLGVISMHVGIAVFMGLVSFGLVMAWLNVALFAVPSTPALSWRLGPLWGAKPQPSALAAGG